MSRSRPQFRLPLRSRPSWPALNGQYTSQFSRLPSPALSRPRLRPLRTRSSDARGVVRSSLTIVRRHRMRSALVCALSCVLAASAAARPEAVTRLTPGADAFFEREVHLSDADAHRLHTAVAWSPDDGVLTFYTAKRAGSPVGALLFVRVDTPHGPLEVAVGFDAAGTVRRVEVTKATVETKPWVLEALRAWLTGAYTGGRAGA